MLLPGVDEMAKIGGQKDKMLLPGVDEMAKIGGQKDKMLLPDQELGGVNLRQMEEIREQQSDR